MIVLEPWERARFEEELLYYARFFQQSGDTLPLEHELIIRRTPRPVRLTFLLVQSAFGLAYESLERVIFRAAEPALVKLTPQGDPAPEIWRILL